MTPTTTLNFNFGQKHIDYMNRCIESTINVAEGAVRAGKTVDNVFVFGYELETSPDKIHLATGSTVANAKLNIGDCNGLGLEYQFRGRCKWGKYKDNECMYIYTATGEKIVIFAGGGKADSFKKIRGNSYGMWIATEINLHHGNTIKEAFNRQLAAKQRKIYWDLNPDNPTAFIYTEYIDYYQEQQEKGDLLFKYNYEHFVLDDNINISDERKAEIKSQYDPKSLWYLRDILGMRVRPEGAIYRIFAENPKKFVTREAPKDIVHVNIAIDFGGSASGTQFVATGFTRNFKRVIVLMTERRPGAVDNPHTLETAFVDFARRVKSSYPMAYMTYGDSAEQILIRGVRVAIQRAGIGLEITNALKTEIVSRIRLVNSLLAQTTIVDGENVPRFQVMEDCQDLITSLQVAVWDETKTEDERLDNGSYNVDVLDAMEYTIEPVANFLQILR